MTTAQSRPTPTNFPANMPATVRLAFEPVTDVAAARAYTWRLAHEHYENFTVVSHLIPRDLRQDFCNIYAFCRTADDLGDEVGDAARSLEFLTDFRNQTHACYEGRWSTAVFAALSETIRKHDIPIEPFLDLIDAFMQDQRVLRYETFEQVLDYCRRSADPVGRLVLYLAGYRDAERQKLSDKTCSALQLANFWQDVRSDILQRNRVYLPMDSMRRFGVKVEQLHQGICDENYRQLLKFEVDRCQAMFEEGQALLPLIRPSLRAQISLFGQGGMAVLEAIRRRNYDTLTSRPVLSRWAKLRLMGQAIAATTIAGAFKGGGQ
jgi:squalene synthase HpnC